jgi:hypothetical protein
MTSFFRASCMGVCRACTPAGGGGCGQGGVGDATRSRTNPQAGKWRGTHLPASLHWYIYVPLHACHSITHAHHATRHGMTNRWLLSSTHGSHSSGHLVTHAGCTVVDDDHMAAATTGKD